MKQKASFTHTMLLTQRKRKLCNADLNDKTAACPAKIENKPKTCRQHFYYPDFPLTSSSYDSDSSC